MGGLFSFYMGLKYKEIFGFSLCYSPAFCLYQETYFKEVFEEYKVDQKLGKIYFLVGDIEYEHQFVSLTKYVYEALLEKGMDQDRIKYIHDLEGIHHESYWTKYFNDSLNFWFEKNK
jgi:predicted alpha/beta superfamily hydrolase